MCVFKDEREPGKRLSGQHLFQLHRWQSSSLGSVCKLFLKNTVFIADIIFLLISETLKIQSVLLGVFFLCVCEYVSIIKISF